MENSLSKSIEPTLRESLEEVLHYLAVADDQSKEVKEVNEKILKVREEVFFILQGLEEEEFDNK